MRRTHQLRKQYRRAAWLGLGFSVIFHAAVLALLRFDVLAFPSPGHSEAQAADLDDAKPLATREALRIVAIRPTPTEAASRAAGRSAASSSAAVSHAAALPARTPAPVSSPPVSDEPAAPIDRLALVDPLRRELIVRTVASAERRTADTAHVEPAADEKAAAYVPGSIGKAKRGWADDGVADTDSGSGIGWGISPGVGGDHCPAPGGGGRGPLWLESR